MKTPEESTETRSYDLSKGTQEGMAELREVCLLMPQCSSAPGFVVSIVGSVHFWLVPWSNLYFSRSIGAFLCSPSNHRVLIYCL